MPLIPELTSDATGQMLLRALSMSSLQHQVIAHNIANANSPGFVPLRIDFETELARARGAAGGTTGNSIAASVQGGARVGPDPSLAPGASAVSSLDLQMARMNENFVRHQLLLQGLGRRLALVDIAMNDGRR